LEKLQKKKERQLLRKQKQLSKKVEYRSKSSIRDYFGYISSEKPCYKKRIEEVESYEEEENPLKFVARNT
jgi:site-specific recombinase XerD